MIQVAQAVLMTRIQKKKTIYVKVGSICVKNSHSEAAQQVK